MKPTIKVSIGGLAFSIEEDAYHILKTYLEALRKHFDKNPEAEEIVADIEARLSELLIMRINNTDVAVTLEDAQETIKIMGNPKDFGDEEAATNDNSNHSKAEETGTFDIFKKKLYRDSDHRIISGICSGLGHYLRVDPAAIRIALIGIILILNIFSFKAAATVVLAYIIFTIIIPKAKTFEQKVSMTGTNPSIENIEDRELFATNKKYRGSIFTDFIRVFFNFIFGFAAVITIIGLIAISGTLLWLYFDTEIFNVRNYLALIGMNTIDFRIAMVLLFILPLVGLFNLFVKGLRRSRFTPTTLVSFIVGLCFWFGAAFYIGNKGISWAKNYRYEASSLENIPLATNSDTIYIRIADEYKNATQQPNTPNLYFNRLKGRDRAVFILPRVQIEQDSLLTSCTVEVDKKVFSRTYDDAQQRANNLRLDYTSKDSLFIISPKWYDNDNPWDREIISIKIKTPANKTIIVEQPLRDYYRFNSDRFHRNGCINKWGWHQDWDWDFD
ncbi:PspC domain-containing protein [Dysgonomonas sp. ZJ279]|uniref:PspC domain-containing protein n=1 Tax=Dysgonomonas sp. ZJ279 TaxID=2709796 RepID=UPI0013EBAAF8|nr:PspC domain-containing protein [Dysgonomonas sp. ZJ279]